MHICNALARLNFFNKGRWGCGSHTIRKFGLEWDFLEDGYHFFRKEKILLGSPRLHIKKKKWKIIVGYNFLGKDIHAWGSFKKRRLFRSPRAATYHRRIRKTSLKESLKEVRILKEMRLLMVEGEIRILITSLD